MLYLWDAQLSTAYVRRQLSGRDVFPSPRVSVCVSGHTISVVKRLNVLVGSGCHRSSVKSLFWVHVLSHVRTTLRCEVSKSEPAEMLLRTHTGLQKWCHQSWILSWGVRVSFAPTRFLSFLVSGDCGYAIVHQRRCIQQVLLLMCARVDSSAPVILQQSWLLKSISTMWRAPTAPSIRAQLNAASTSAAFCKALVFFLSFRICSCYFLISFIYFCFYRLSCFLLPQRGRKVLHVSIATCLQVCVCLQRYVCVWSACVASCPRHNVVITGAYLRAN